MNLPLDSTEELNLQDSSEPGFLTLGQADSIMMTKADVCEILNLDDANLIQLLEDLDVLLTFAFYGATLYHSTVTDILFKVIHEE